jgi:mRNA interferase MazF
VEKDFDNWNISKKTIHFNKSSRFCHPREVWWCALGVNVGFEQDGTGENFDRPIVVIKGFNQNIFFGVALTGSKKIGKYYLYLGKIDDHEASAVLSQVRLIDTKRLVRKITTLDQKLFEQLKNALKQALFS